MKNRLWKIFLILLIHCLLIGSGYATGEDENEINSLLIQASLLEKEGKLAEALTHYERILEVSPDHEEAQRAYLRLKVKGFGGKTYVQDNHLKVEARKRVDQGFSKIEKKLKAEEDDRVALDGLWVMDPPDQHDYIYRSGDLALYIFKDTAILFSALSTRIVGNFIIKQRMLMWPQRNSKKLIPKYIVLYLEVHKDFYDIYSGGMYNTEQNLEDFPDRPTDSRRSQRHIRCKAFPPDISFLHAEGIAFMRAFSEISRKCEQNRSDCLEHVFSFIDLTKDNELSKAELCRLFRILTYFSLVSKAGGAENKDITGGIGIASILFPTIAGSVISGSDYDNDGQLSLDEIFYDRNMKDVEVVFEKFSFDIAQTFLTKIFQSLGGILRFFN